MTTLADSVQESLFESGRWTAETTHCSLGKFSCCSDREGRRMIAIDRLLNTGHSQQCMATFQGGILVPCGYLSPGVFLFLPSAQLSSLLLRWSKRDVGARVTGRCTEHVQTPNWFGQKASTSICHGLRPVSKGSTGFWFTQWV